ncbi:MAG: hypothetical protein JJE04_26650 [Acidobacteriia bacterium]|nr:hypothetical protein [Terriglobia bacterium]
MALLKAASEYVSFQGGNLIEGYPIVPKMKIMPDVFGWTGVVNTFDRAGFTACPTTSRSRKIVRLAVRPLKRDR